MGASTSSVDAKPIAVVLMTNSVKRSRAARRLPRFLVFVACLGSTTVARADPSATDRSLAQSLFDQAKDLMRTGDYVNACPKLEESQRLDPSGGTLLNLALCHEREGRLATAWTEFKEALSVAKRDQREDRLTAAEEHIAAIAPLLPWVTVVVTEHVSDLEIMLDNAVVASAAWHSPLSVDPGVHRLVARAPGFETWSSEITLARSQRVTLTVPRLRRTPVTPVSTPPPPSRARPQRDAATSNPPSGVASGRKALGWALAGTGAAALGVGTFFGFRAIEQKHESDSQCPTDTTCFGDGVALNRSAHTSAWIADVGFGLGLLGLGVGGYFILSAPSVAVTTGQQPRQRWAAEASVVTQGALLRLRGEW